MTTPVFEEPHSYLIAMTTPTDQVVAAIDLDYELAIDSGGWTTEGVYVDPQPAGARIVVDDQTTSVVYYLTGSDCIRLAHYLLACAKAAADRIAGLP